MRTLVAHLIAASILATACTPAPPPDVDVVPSCRDPEYDPSNFSVRVGQQSTSCGFTGEDDLTVRLMMRVPPGAELTLAGEPWRAGAEGHELALAPWILGQPASFVDRQDVPVPIAVTLNGEVHEKELIVSFRGWSIVHRLAKRVRSGQPLAGRSAPAASPPTMLVAQKFEARYFGKPAKMADFDLVVMVDEVQEESQICNYKAVGGGRDSTLIAAAYTDTYIVYDARTAKEVTRRRFPPGGPMPTCPSTIEGGSLPALETRVSKAEVDAWLEQVRAGAR